jgi:hypothetical protein
MIIVRSVFFEKKKELKERRSKVWPADESKAEETLLSGDVCKIEEFYMSQASLIPFYLFKFEL